MKDAPEILMVDDNQADIDLTSEVLAQSKGHFHLSAVNDGEEAVLFLRRQGKYDKAPLPDLVVLDLNLPRKDGCEVLADIKADPSLAKTPVVIFTTSQSSTDVLRSYELGANCYLQKPGSLPEFVAAVESMADFWLRFASLPQREKR